MHFQRIVSCLTKSIWSNYRRSLSYNKPSLINNFKASLTTFSKPCLNYSLWNFSKSFKLNFYQCAVFSSSTQSRSTPLDKELSSFLEEEIRAEKAQFTPTQGVNGFEIEKNGADLTFKKIFKNEIIRVKVNVNGSINSEENAESIEAENENFAPEMSSKPDFAVEIRKPNGQAFCLHCIISSEDRVVLESNEQENQERNEDLFEIDNFVIVDYKANDDIVIQDNVYFGDASILDGQLYDLLMDYLEERGINNEFVNSLINYCTSHEHKLYVELLNKLKNFINSK